MIVVCGQARSGTSMMMRILQQGGIPIAYTPAKDTEWAKKVHRNPYGLFELDPPRVEGNFKCLYPNMMNQVPMEAKLIYITRNIEAMLDSYKESAPDKRVPSSHIAKVHRVRAKWTEIMAARKHLPLDYDAVCADPLKAARQIADFLGEPFDVAKAAAAVDLGLHKNRATVP